MYHKKQQKGKIMTESKERLCFRPVKAESIEILEPYFCLRPNKTCDSVFLESFLWRKYSNLRYAISKNRAVQWIMNIKGEERGQDSDIPNSLPCRPHPGE